MTATATSRISMCSNSFFVYVLYGWGKHFEVAVSLNLDIMTSFWIHKWPRTPTSEPSKRVKLCKAVVVCWWTAYQCAQTLCICLIGCGKQFEVAVSLNLDVMTSF
jgi:hypothetical protein